MRTRKEITAEIRALKAEMKERGLRVISCFNGGLSREEMSANQTLFRLKHELNKTP